MTSYPMRAAMAALRSLRRAVWVPTPPDDLILCLGALVEPMDTLIARWESLGAAVVGYEEDRCSESLDLMHAALLDFDEALGVFFGPSGWEPQKGANKQRPRSSTPKKTDRDRYRTP